MALTDTAVQQTKATGKAYTLGDMDGLSLAVSPQGGKSWHFRYYWGGAQKRMSLGTYPEVPLREARQARDEARALLAGCANPHTHRKQKRQAVRMACEHTFEAVFHQWIEHHKRDIKTGKRSTHSAHLRQGRSAPSRETLDSRPPAGRPVGSHRADREEEHALGLRTCTRPPQPDLPLCVGEGAGTRNPLRI
jgi:hypothetical protein